MSFQHRAHLLLFLISWHSFTRLALERLPRRRSLAIGIDAEDLIKPKPGEEIPAAVFAMNYVKMPTPKFFQTQGHTCHSSHECRIHHDAISQIDHELSITAIHHLSGKFLEAPAVQETSFTRNFHPYGRTVY